ncbi:hypothetical protein [Metarhizobium album]|uniref:hypothetical protein n=1 Tax=Metarhizobium album TaxID=2182425 RepID=UPI000FFEEC8E|nr:hypothetical protein [Rhizobium album]
MTRAGKPKAAAHDTKPIKAVLARLFCISPDWLALACDGIRVVCANAANWAPPLGMQEGWMATYPYFGLQFEFVYGWVQGVERVLFTGLCWRDPGSPRNLVTHIGYVSLAPGSPYVRGDLTAPTLRAPSAELPFMPRDGSALLSNLGTKAVPEILTILVEKVGPHAKQSSLIVVKRDTRQRRIFLPQHVPRSWPSELPETLVQLLFNSTKETTMKEIITGTQVVKTLPHWFMCHPPIILADFHVYGIERSLPQSRDVRKAPLTGKQGGRLTSCLASHVGSGADFTATRLIGHSASAADPQRATRH